MKSHLVYTGSKYPILPQKGHEKKVIVDIALKKTEGCKLVNLTVNEFYSKHFFENSGKIFSAQRLLNCTTSKRS